MMADDAYADWATRGGAAAGGTGTGADACAEAGAPVDRSAAARRQRCEWVRARFPGARPPRREDAASLRLWLQQQLQPPPRGAGDDLSLPAPLLPDGGGLDAGALAAQEAALSAALGELCRQVAVGCADRGRLLAQLWAGLGGLLRAALADRARLAAAAEQACAGGTAAREQAAAAARRAADEAGAMRALVDRNAGRAAEARAACERSEERARRLEAQLAATADARRSAARVAELEPALSRARAEAARLAAALSEASAARDAARASADAAGAAAAAAAAEAARLRAQLGASTPRPAMDMGLVADLLSSDELGLVERALTAGVPAELTHRLLLGLTAAGADVGAWPELLGCCRAALDAQPDQAARAALRARLVDSLAACDADGLARHVDGGALEALSRAAHLGVDREALLCLMDGTLGGDSSGGSGDSGIGNGGDGKAGPPCAAAAVDLRPYRKLLGALAARYGHDAAELGGAVTQALAHAALPTRGRMLELAERAKALHREAVLTKRALADQRKQEAERLKAALKDQERQILRRGARPPSLIEKFVATKFGDYFQGLGTHEELPRVLRTAAPVNNRRMPKREAERLLGEAWAAKDELEAAQGGARMPLRDFLWPFLEKKCYANPRLIVEAGYNLVYSLSQHQYDADCRLGLAIICGDCEESVRDEQAALARDVLTALRLVDVSVNQRATGWLHKADVKCALSGFFARGGKRVERVDEVFEALDTDERADMVAYSRLFEEDEACNQTMFAETLRAQCLAERLELLQDVEDAVRDHCEDAATTELTPAALLAAVCKARKGALAGAAAEALVARVFGAGWRAREREGATASLLAAVRAIRRGDAPAATEGVAGQAAGGASSAASAGGGQQQLGGKAAKQQQQKQQQQQQKRATRGSTGGAPPNGRRSVDAGAAGRAWRSTAAADDGSSKTAARNRRSTAEAPAARGAQRRRGAAAEPSGGDASPGGAE